MAHLVSGKNVMGPILKALCLEGYNVERIVIDFAVNRVVKVYITKSLPGDVVPAVVESLGNAEGIEIIESDVTVNKKGNITRKS